MKTKILIVVTLSWLTINQICAQNLIPNSGFEDVIYLKNGSIIRGVIIDHKFGEYVKIESCGKNVWVFRSEDIDRIEKEKLILVKRDLNFKEKGYYNITDIGMLAGRDVYQNKYSFSFLILNGYQFKNRLSLGLGIGLEILDIPLAPVLLDIRYSFLKGKFTPFLAIKGGYSIPLVNYYDNGNNPKYKGGYLIGSVIGIRNYFTDNSAIVFSVGFRHQQLKSTRTTWWWEEGEQITEVTQYFNRIAVRVGYLFN
ncbi:hypothetical protein JYU16_00470 [bacterium AH-315-M05]|nr:hypothetical protein [bacterium AH-315-M05]